MAADLSDTIENQWLSDCAIFPLDKFLKYNSFHISNYIFIMCLIDEITLF